MDNLTRIARKITFILFIEQSLASPVLLQQLH